MRICSEESLTEWEEIMQPEVEEDFTVPPSLWEAIQEEEETDTEEYEDEEDYIEEYEVYEADDDDGSITVDDFLVSLILKMIEIGELAIQYVKRKAEYASKETSYLDIDTSDLTFVSPVPKVCICQFCKQVMSEPCHLTCCNASYCKKCAKQMVSHSQACNNCTSKSYRIKTDSIDKAVWEIIGNLYVVYHPQEDYKCMWNGKLKDLEKHIQENVEPSMTQFSNAQGTTTQDRFMMNMEELLLRNKLQESSSLLRRARKKANLFIFLLFYGKDKARKRKGIVWIS